MLILNSFKVMKTPRLFGLSLLLCLFVSTTTHAQIEPAAPAGYWNLETNLTTRDYTTVRFYNAADQLIYTETLSNLCLDLSRATGLCRRTKGQLNAALQLVQLDPVAATQRGDLLAAQFGSDRRMQRVYATR